MLGRPLTVDRKSIFLKSSTKFFKLHVASIFVEEQRATIPPICCVNVQVEIQSSSAELLTQVKESLDIVYLTLLSSPDYTNDCDNGNFLLKTRLERKFPLSQSLV